MSTSSSENIKRARKAFDALTHLNDRFSRNTPQQPVQPSPPLETVSQYEDIVSDYCTNDMRLSDVVDKSLLQAGIDPETLPAEMREAFDLTSIEARRAPCDEDLPYLSVVWERRHTNPKYKEQSDVYRTKMIAYEAACAEYADKCEQYVQERNEYHAYMENKKDFAEWQRLQKKFGKG